MMNPSYLQQVRNSSLNVSNEPEDAHQQTLDYLEKELKEVSAANQPHIDKFEMIPHPKITPLVFKLSIHTHGFLISYKQNQMKSSLFKILVLLIVASVMTIPLFYYSEISTNLRNVIISLMFSVPFLYTVLFFLDPGTVFEDEEETFAEERIYCMSCKIYRNLSTKHCSFCNKCCKKYDHHCSVFGKCIGKRNLLFFYLFIICTALTFILYFIASIGELYGQFNQKSPKA